jgi:hypothetical protein
MDQTLRPVDSCRKDCACVSLGSHRQRELVVVRGRETCQEGQTCATERYAVAPLGAVAAAVVVVLEVIERPGCNPPLVALLPVSCYYTSSAVVVVVVAEPPEMDREPIVAVVVVVQAKQSIYAVGARQNDHRNATRRSGPDMAGLRQRMPDQQGSEDASQMVASLGTYGDLDAADEVSFRRHHRHHGDPFLLLYAVLWLVRWDS